MEKRAIVEGIVSTILIYSRRVDANQPQTAEKGENLENQLESTQNS